MTRLNLRCGAGSLAGLALVVDHNQARVGETPATKFGPQVMQILETFDLTRCAHAASELAGCDEKTVTRHVALRDGGGNPLG